MVIFHHNHKLEIMILKKEKLIFDETEEYELENRIPEYNDRILYKIKNIYNLILCKYN